MFVATTTFTTNNIPTMLLPSHRLSTKFFQSSNYVVATDKTGDLRDMQQHIIGRRHGVLPDDRSLQLIIIIVSFVLLMC